MLDRSHPTNKHDVEIARIRRTTTIVAASIGTLATVVGTVFAALQPPG